MILAVARKEFTDQITSKRFLAFLLAIILITGFSMYSGAKSFKERSEAFYTGQIEKKPSIVSIFNTLGNMGISSFGGFLGLLMGFDLITREKERNSLRTLLSHPVYRDSIINGKALGAFAALSVAVILTIVISLGVIMINGITPSMDDLINITKFGCTTLAYLFTFFSIALFASTITKDSGSSLLIAFGVFIILTAIIPLLGLFLSEAIAGEAPPLPNKSLDESMLKEYRKEFEEYWKKRMAIMDFFTIFSPSANYQRIISSLDGTKFSERVIFEEDVTKNIISFISIPVIFFVLSYIKFLRMEI
ncbi:TPA: ABC transporter permease [Candidatus Bathyarchaeota archaeon]|nr:ABC transporter permease [Candidatus Bathyarchaeota archaeon]